MDKRNEVNFISNLLDFMAEEDQDGPCYNFTERTIQWMLQQAYRHGYAQGKRDKIGEN